MARGLDETFKIQMTCFPCMFNMERSAIKDEKDFKAKLETVLEEDDIDTDVRKINFITWLQFNLAQHESAIGSSEKAVKLSKGKDLVSLANKVYILKYLGDKINSEQCLILLEKRKSDSDFRLFLADAKAQQAYCYARMGDEYNQDHAINLYIQALQSKDDSQWNYGLGLACMRTIHSSMIRHNFKLSIQERVQVGADALFKVAVNSPDVSLQGQCYMNLALLQSYARRYSVRLFCEDDYRKIFNGQNVEQLIDKAVALGPDDHRVLADCGRAIADDNKMKAKQLLEKSNQIKRNSKACHQLGFLTSNLGERLSLWFDAIKLSHYRNQAVERGIQKLLREPKRGNILKQCFLQRVNATPGQKDVLVLSQEKNDMVDKVYEILTKCFGLDATSCIQSELLNIEVARYKVVILVIPQVTRSDFTDVVRRLVQMTAQNGPKVKVLVKNSSVTIPNTIQQFQQFSMAEIYDHIRSGPVSYQSLFGNSLHMTDFIKLFNFITENN